MFVFFVLFIVFTSLQACPPLPSTRAPTTTSRFSTRSTFTSAGTTTTTKPEPEEVQVTVITKENYDMNLNDAHTHAIKALINDYAKINGIVYNENFVRESTRNEGGRFAIIFTILGVGCDQVTSFATGAKYSTNYISTVKVKCGNQEFSI